MGTSLYPSAMEPRKPGACFRPKNLGVDSRVVTFRLGEQAKLLTYPMAPSYIWPPRHIVQHQNCQIRLHFTVMGGESLCLKISREQLPTYSQRPGRSPASTPIPLTKRRLVEGIVPRR